MTMYVNCWNVISCGLELVGSGEQKDGIKVVQGK